jgi:hypothetical protein
MVSALSAFPLCTSLQRAEIERLTALFAEEKRSMTSVINHLERDVGELQEHLQASREEVRGLQDLARTASGSATESERNAVLERELERERSKV